MYKEKPFYCYSARLKNWFISNGLPYVNEQVHHGTGKTFWIFKGGRVLDLLLTEYRINNKK